ncbi:transposase [Rhizorhabdus histidinilytica]|uniref:transposase n=1 Tax=Rhizorhabdus histidinilytica TaxID=439228 RepID=UPI001F1D97B0|nr:transposase [Rhizorhabdus histidinilytica]
MQAMEPSDTASRRERRRLRHKTRLRAPTGRWVIEIDLAPEAPLGWRFWTLAGFPSDPVEPRPYGGTRCIPLAQVELQGSTYWLCAMELDESFGLFTAHELFPCPAQHGAAGFARRMIALHAIEPTLL